MKRTPSQHAPAQDAKRADVTRARRTIAIAAAMKGSAALRKPAGAPQEPQRKTPRRIMWPHWRQLNSRRAIFGSMQKHADVFNI